MDILGIQVDSRTAWRCLPVAALLVGTGAIEGRRYEVHPDVRFDAALAYGKTTISRQSTGENVTVSPAAAVLTLTGYAPTVLVSPRITAPVF